MICLGVFAEVIVGCGVFLTEEEISVWEFESWLVGGAGGWVGGGWANVDRLAYDSDFFRFLLLRCVMLFW